MTPPSPQQTQTSRDRSVWVLTDHVVGHANQSLGVYAVVAAPGRAAVGDPVELR